MSVIHEPYCQGHPPPYLLFGQIVALYASNQNSGRTDPTILSNLPFVPSRPIHSIGEMPHLPQGKGRSGRTTPPYQS